MEEKVIISVTTAQLIMIKLQTLPYNEIQPIMDELTFGLNNPITFSYQQPQQQEKKEERPIGFVRYENGVDLDDYNDGDDEDEDKAKKNK